MLNDFFSMDGPFFKYGSLVFDLIILNLLFAVVSGPLLLLMLITYGAGIFTALPAGGVIFYILSVVAMIHIGPALTALFYVTNRKVREDDGYLFKDYFTSYKMNYKQSLIISSILFVVLYVLNINIAALTGINVFSTILYLLNLGPEPAAVADTIFNFGMMKNILFPVQFFILMEILFTTIFIFPVLARFHMSTKEIVKNAFILANKHLLTTLGCIVLTVAIFLLIFMVHPIFIVVAISGYAMLASYMFERVFKNYIPGEDTEVERELYSTDEDYEVTEQESLAEIFKRKREEEKND